jgi:hypothetical protein
MLHSRHRPRRSQQSANVSSREDPYSPDSSAFAERHTVYVSEVQDIPGLVRVDIGAPVPKS